MCNDLRQYSIERAAEWTIYSAQANRSFPLWALREHS